MIHVVSQAGFFAGMVADETANRWQGVHLTNQFQSLFEFPFGDEGHVASRILTDGTGFLAGRERNLPFKSFFSPLCAIEGSPEAFFFLPIFWNELSRTSPDADVTTVTLGGLDVGPMCSSFNQGAASLNPFRREGP